MTDYFTHSPSPAAPGTKVRICFNFDAAGVTTSLNITLDYSPSSVPDGNATLTPAKPCVEVTIPSDATTLIVVDDSGVSEDHNVPIS
jgi:hypothetical protein